MVATVMLKVNMTGARGLRLGSRYRDDEAVNVSVGGPPEPTLQGQLVTGGYFSLLGVEPVAGRAIGPDDEHLAAVRAKMRELKAPERSLTGVVASCDSSCAGGPGPAWVILDDLTKPAAPSRPRMRRAGPSF